ncbi:MAG: methyltransferase domain-containing protein [Prolixibacteraceae bacterium]|jgi:ubiquinone/menaquinone biosynthesis C-methylase UbiE|nr:methyltransferase domain-containing protein [Prolixibacteraceae bacterium]
MRELVDFFQDKKVLSVLDVGCGSGDFIEILARVFPEKTKITGIDPFEGPLGEARRKFPSVEFLEMKGEQMEFPDNYFDVVSISFALHHLADVPKTLSEMKRVVKPGGWLIVNEIVSEVQNEAQENQKMLHHLKSLTDRLNGIPHRETYSINEVLEIVRSNGIVAGHSFLNLKMKEPSFTPDFLRDKISQMENHFEKLKGHVLYKMKPT